MNAALLPLPDNLSPDVNKHEKPQYNYPQLVTKGTSGDLKTGRHSTKQEKEKEDKDMVFSYVAVIWEKLGRIFNELHTVFISRLAMRRQRLVHPQDKQPGRNRAMFRLLSSPPPAVP